MAKSKITIAPARRRKTAPAVETAPPASQPIVFNTLADLMAAFKSFVGTPGLVNVPASPTPTPAVAASRSHKTYGINPDPRPPFGTVTMQVFEHLKAHGFKTQAQLESETGLTEGQIKGSIRQLTLAGYIANGSDRE